MGMDYPLFRSLIRKNAKLFQQKILAFHNNHDPRDLRPFLQKNLRGYTIIYDAIAAKKVPADWRNTCINACLEKSTSDWVLFMEQDFFPFEKGFFPHVFTEAEKYDVIGFTEGAKKWTKDIRLHPAFLLAKRTYIERTSKNFSALPLYKDHFCGFCRELLQLAPSFASLKEIGATNWKHWTGQTSNLYLIDQNRPPNRHPKDFRDYCRLSLTCGIETEPSFKRLLERSLKT